MAGPPCPIIQAGWLPVSAPPPPPAPPRDSADGLSLIFSAPSARTTSYIPEATPRQACLNVSPPVGQAFSSLVHGMSRLPIMLVSEWPLWAPWPMKPPLHCPNQAALISLGSIPFSTFFRQFKYAS